MSSDASNAHDKRNATARQRAVGHGLTPIVRIADLPMHWTMEERLAHYGCPGVSVAMIHGGEIDWVGGYGVRTAGQPEPCGPDTVYMVASCSKPVTAMLVMQQVERGVLHLDRDVNDYMRRWQVPANEFTATTPVTLRRALSHTAGLMVGGWGVVPAEGPLPSVFDLLEGRPPSTMPAVRVDKADGVERYSGSGYLIAQLVLEDVLGVDFAELAHEMVFEPLSMIRSSFRTRCEPRLLDDAAAGHTGSGTSHPMGSLAAAETAAGGLHSTARDYARFLLGVRSAWLGEPGAVLGQAATLEATTRVPKSSFGLGFRVLGEGPTLRLNHGGSNDGYQSETNLYLERGDGGVVLTNGESGIFLYREVFNALADVGGWPDFSPAPKRLAQLTTDQLQRYAGDFRIMSGVEMPVLRVWVDDGRLFSEIPGMRMGVQEAFVDVDGVVFNQAVPFETRVEFGADGRASALQVHEGDLPIIRAERVD